ncbi:unnamed protein product, partial [Prorocentrum cordatum]
EESLRGGMGTRKQMAGEEDEDDVLCQGAPTASVKNFCGGAWGRENRWMMRMTRSPTGLNRPRPGSDSGHEQITPRVQPLPLQKPLPQKAPA